MDTIYGNKKYLQSLNAADYYRGATLRPSVSRTLEFVPHLHPITGISLLKCCNTTRCFFLERGEEQARVLALRLISSCRLGTNLCLINFVAFRTILALLSNALEFSSALKYLLASFMTQQKGFNHEQTCCSTFFMHFHSTSKIRYVISQNNSQNYWRNGFLINFILWLRQRI